MTFPLLGNPLDASKHLDAFLKSRPLESFDSLTRGALCVLAMDLECMTVPAESESFRGERPEWHRLLFSRPLNTSWKRFEGRAVAALAFGFSRASKSRPSPERCRFSLEIGMSKPWISSEGRGVTMSDLRECLCALPGAPWIPRVLEGLARHPHALFRSELLQPDAGFPALLDVSLERGGGAGRVPLHVVYSQEGLQKLTAEPGAFERQVVLWHGPGGVQVALGSEVGRRYHAGTRAFLEALAPFFEGDFSALLRAFVTSPLFAPLVLPTEHDAQRAKLHFPWLCREAEHHVWASGGSRTAGTIARTMVELGARLEGFKALSAGLKAPGPQGDRLRECFEPLWMAGALATRSVWICDVPLPSARDMLRAFGAPRPKVARGHERTTRDVPRWQGLWRAKRGQLRAADLTEASLAHGAQQLEATMRGDLSVRGLASGLAPRVSLDRAKDAPEARYDQGERVLWVAPRLFERPWSVVSECGLWALAHALERVYTERNAAATYTIRGAGEENDPWHLACRRLALSSDWTVRRDSYSDVPENAWLQRDSLSEDEARFLEKVDKLLALSASANEHEAALAMERAHALLERRGLDRRTRTEGPSQGNGMASSFVTLTISLGVKKRNATSMALASLLVSHYQVRAVWSTEYDLTEACEFVSLTLMGRKESVLLAEHVFDFLEQQLESLWVRARKERGLAPAGRLSFQLGLLAGFREKLDTAARRRTDSAGSNEAASRNALLKLERNDLETYVAARFPKLSSSSGGAVTIDADGFAAGRAEGANLTIHTPLSARARGSEEAGTRALPNRRD